MQIDVVTNQGPQRVDAKRVGFSVISENWNEYQLEDGRTMRIKVVLTRVLVPVDGMLRQPNGEEIVNFATQVIGMVDEKE